MASSYPLFHLRSRRVAMLKVTALSTGYLFLLLFTVQLYWPSRLSVAGSQIEEHLDERRCYSAFSPYLARPYC